MACIYLVVIEPPSGGRFEHHLKVGDYVLGRAEESADIVVHSPEVSRRHVRFGLRDWHCTVEDLGSTSGTIHKGERLTSQQVFSCPVEIQLGTVRVRVEACDVSGSATPGADAAGHYYKGRAIAKGGMGEVLEANDQLLGRTVAMKIIRQDIGDPESARMRFVREATVLARLEHPSIVPIYEMGRDGIGQLFYAMKLVHGVNLSHILKQIRAGDTDTISEYPLARLLNIFRKVCDAVAFAHTHQVIHRDLKPENIMVGAYGEVLVMDWGLAKILDDAAQQAAERNTVAFNPEAMTMPEGFQELSESEMAGMTANLTVDGAVMGTPNFMAPEQAEGRIADLDARTDIYALGGILYNLLTLRTPVQGKSLKKVLSDVRSGNITPPTIYNSRTGEAAKSLPDWDGTAAAGESTPIKLAHLPGGRVPSALSAVAMHALATQPENRYPSVIDLAEDIDAYTGGYATSAEAVGTLGLIRLFIARNRVLSAAAAIVVLVTLGFMGKVVESERRAQTSATEAAAEAKTARAAETTARAAEAVARAEKENSRRALGQAQIALAEAASRDGDIIGLFRHLEACPADLRETNWQYLNGKRNTCLGQLSAQGRVTGRGFAFRPRTSGSRPEFAFINGPRGIGREVVFHEFATMRWVRTINIGRKTGLIAISPDGRTLATGGDGDPVNLFDIATQERARTLNLEFNGFDEMKFSADGTRLFYRRRRPGTLYCADATDGRTIWKYDAPLAQSAVDPLGRYVAVHHMDALQTVNLIDVKTGKPVRTLEPGNDFLWQLAFSDDGSFLAGGDFQGYASIWDLQSGQLRSRVRAGGGRLTSLAFTRQNHLITLCNETQNKTDETQKRLRLWIVAEGTEIDSRLGVPTDAGLFLLEPTTGRLVCDGARMTLWQFPLQPADITISHSGASGYVAAFLGDYHLLCPGDQLSEWMTMRELPVHGDPPVVWRSRTFRDSRSFAVTPDQSVAVLARGTSIAMLRRTGTNQPVMVEARIKQAAVAIGVSRSGRRILMVDGNRVHLADPEQVAPLKTYKTPGNGTRIAGKFAAFMKDDTRVVAVFNGAINTGQSESLTYCWDVKSGELVIGITNYSRITAFAVSPDGKEFAIGTQDKRITIMNADLKPVRSFRAHDRAVSALIYHPTLPLIASGSYDLSIKFWNARTGLLLGTLLGPEKRLDALSFSVSGNRLACAAPDGKTRVWDFDSPHFGKMIAEERGELSKP